MTTISLWLPDPLYKHVRELARKEGISMNHFISTAVAEKMSALMTEEYLEARGQRGSRARFEEILAKVPDDGPPVPGDEL